MYIGHLINNQQATSDSWYPGWLFCSGLCFVFWGRLQVLLQDIFKKSFVLDRIEEKILFKLRQREEIVRQGRVYAGKRRIWRQKVGNGINKMQTLHFFPFCVLKYKTFIFPLIINVCTSQHVLPLMNILKLNTLIYLKSFCSYLCFLQ